MSWAGAVLGGSRTHAYGWISLGGDRRSVDGDTDMGHYWKLSQTTIHEMTKGSQEFVTYCNGFENEQLLGRKL